MEVDILSMTEAEKKIPENNLIFMSEVREHIVPHSFNFLMKPDKELEKNVQDQIDHYFSTFKDYEMTVEVKITLTKKGT